MNFSTSHLRVKLFTVALLASSGMSYQAGRHIGLPSANVAEADTHAAKPVAVTAPVSPGLVSTAPPSPTPSPVPIVTPTPTVIPVLIPEIPASTPVVPPPAPKPAPVRTVAHGSYPNTYFLGQCTYYVASRRPIPPLWGNANAWYNSAVRAGWAVGITPSVGAVAWTGVGGFGHVALVENISGNQIYISEMNYNGNWNRVTYRWADAAAFKYIY